MQLSFQGNQCFKIKGRQAVIIIGPFSADKKTDSQIVLSPGLNQAKSFKRLPNEPLFISSPGEYEIQGISIFGKKEMFVIEADEVRSAYFTKAAENLSEEEQEALSDIDILLLNLGPVLSLDQATKLINEVQPKLVAVADSSEAASLLKSLGFEEPKKEKKLTINKGSLPEEMSAVIMEAKNG